MLSFPWAGKGREPNYAQTARVGGWKILALWSSSSISVFNLASQGFSDAPPHIFTSNQTFTGERGILASLREKGSYFFIEHPQFLQYILSILASYHSLLTFFECVKSTKVEKKGKAPVEYQRGFHLYRVGTNTLLSSPWQNQPSRFPLCFLCTNSAATMVKEN